MIIAPRFYRGPYKALSIAIVAGISVAGYFFPAAGLFVIAMMVTALVINSRQSRGFCTSVCPNGRSLSALIPNRTNGKSLPKLMAAKEFRRALCGFAMFCMLNLSLRSGGALAGIGRVFWMIYLASVGISFVMGVVFKPRAWCSICPMGTLQDSLRSIR